MEQYLISFLTITSIGLAYWHKHDLRRWACLCGLAAQPCWIVLIVNHNLVGLMPLAPLYTALYGWAVYQQWVLPARERPLDPSRTS